MFVIVELQDPADASATCLRGAIGSDIALTHTGGASSFRTIGSTVVSSSLAAAAACETGGILDIKDRLAIVGIVCIS